VRQSRSTSDYENPLQRAGFLPLNPQESRMKAYLALTFADQKESRNYLAEVGAVVKAIAGDNFKRGAGAASVVAVAFLTDKDRSEICDAFKPLWRPEQRTWVLPLDQALLMDASLKDWALRALNSQQHR
jgi:hypothetical protein